MDVRFGPEVDIHTAVDDCVTPRNPKSWTKTFSRVPSAIFFLIVALQLHPPHFMATPQFVELSKGEFPNVASNERRVLRRGDYFCLFCSDDSRREAWTFGNPHEGAFRRYYAAAIRGRCLHLQSVSPGSRRRRQTNRVRRKLQREQLDCGHSNEAARLL